MLGNDEEAEVNSKLAASTLGECFGLNTNAYCVSQAIFVYVMRGQNMLNDLLFCKPFFIIYY